MHPDGTEHLYGKNKTLKHLYDLQGRRGSLSDDPKQQNSKSGYICAPQNEKRLSYSDITKAFKDRRQARRKYLQQIKPMKDYMQQIIRRKDSTQKVQRTSKKQTSQANRNLSKDRDRQCRERTAGRLSSLAQHVLTFLIRREMKLKTTGSSLMSRNQEV